jgi:hypothetical protein
MVKEMSKQPVDPIVPSPPDMYTQLRGKIIDGSISLEETKQLYKEFAKISPDKARAEAIEIMNKDLHPEISSDKFHSFAYKLVEVEKQIVTEAFPKKDTDSPEQRKAVTQKRCNEYMRNTSLAKNVVLYECTKNEFVKDISESLIKGNKEVAKEQLVGLKIPDYLQEHYSSITEFYKENGNEKGAMTNLVFHVVTTAASHYGKSSLDPVSVEYLNFVKSLNVVTKSVYSPKIPGSYNPLGAQIPGYTPEAVPVQVEVSAKPIETAVPQVTEPVAKGELPAPEGKSKPTFMERVGSAISTFVDKIKELVGVKEKSVAPVTQNLQNSVATPVIPKDPKQQNLAPEKIVSTAIDVPISRPRSNAVIERATALRERFASSSSAVSTTSPPPKVSKGKNNDVGRSG